MHINGHGLELPVGLSEWRVVLELQVGTGTKLNPNPLPLNWNAQMFVKCYRALFFSFPFPTLRLLYSNI